MAGLLDAWDWHSFSGRGSSRHHSAVGRLPSLWSPKVASQSTSVDAPLPIPETPKAVRVLLRALELGCQPRMINNELHSSMDLAPD
eukprot:562794-Amphidinium_carterae.1